MGHSGRFRAPEPPDLWPPSSDLQLLAPLATMSYLNDRFRPKADNSLTIASENPWNSSLPSPPLSRHCRGGGCKIPKSLTWGGKTTGGRMKTWPVQPSSLLRSSHPSRSTPARTDGCWWNSRQTRPVRAFSIASSSGPTSMPMWSSGTWSGSSRKESARP